MPEIMGFKMEIIISGVLLFASECFCLAFLPLPGGGHALLTTLPVSPNQAHGRCRMSAGYEQFADFLREKCISFYVKLSTQPHIWNHCFWVCV